MFLGELPACAYLEFFYHCLFSLGGVQVTEKEVGEIEVPALGPASLAA